MSTSSKNIHLAISAIIITVIALTYGLFPTITLPMLFDFNANSTDLNEIFRALMGLYLGMATLWLAGILKPNLWMTATISNVVFMIGLAIGRVLSLFIDGIPSAPFLVGLALEVVIAFWGLRNLSKFKSV